VARFSQLADWLAWQEHCHWPKVDPGLGRISTVLGRMGLDQPPYLVVTIGGTNGKGSTVALLEAMLLAAGYRVGSYTSPHLLRYNERIRVQGEPAADEVICQSFARIDTCRHDVSLTYFEFGTLAAVDIFQQAALDIALLEVGLGGRLDAVNALNADVAVIATVDIDHVNWLGPDRESIGLEKAGIFRPQHPAVYGDLQPPLSLVSHAKRLATPLYQLGKDFHYRVADENWYWWSSSTEYTDLPWPRLGGYHQYQNAATALMVLKLIAERLPVTMLAIQQGLTSVYLPGRFQRLTGEVERVFDVAHNPQGSQILAQALAQTPCYGRTYAVLGMLKDKDVAGVVANLRSVVDRWYLGGLEGERGLSGEALAERMGNTAATPVSVYPSVTEAYQGALEVSQSGDRVVAFGSFHTVEAAMRVEGWASLAAEQLNRLSMTG
jgi:dihydrofolate synthase / folylpolyglutamate synthase